MTLGIVNINSCMTSKLRIIKKKIMIMELVAGKFLLYIVNTKKSWAQIYRIKKISKNHTQGVLWPKLTNGGMHLVVICASPNYCMYLSATDIGAKNPI